MHFDDRLADGETQSKTFLATLQLLEGIEDFV